MGGICSTNVNAPGSSTKSCLQCSNQASVDFVKREAKTSGPTASTDPGPSDGVDWSESTKHHRQSDLKEDTSERADRIRGRKSGNLEKQLGIDDGDRDCDFVNCHHLRGVQSMWNAHFSTSQYLLTVIVSQVPPLNLRIEGHTSFAKKSKDGGAQTSSDRAKAVKAHLIDSHVPAGILFPVGLGSSRPENPKKPADPDNRRVEIHVMSDFEAKASRLAEMNAN
jgi:hypothetical protein